MVRLSASRPACEASSSTPRRNGRIPVESVQGIRPAARMLADGERSGALTRGKIILDATSGNTGIAYAMIGAARGYRVRLCVPGNVTPERNGSLSQAFGAEIVYTESDGRVGRREYIRAKAMYTESPDVFTYPDQYNNSATGGRTTTPPPRKSSSRRAAASPTSWLGSARAGPSSAPAAGCGNSTLR